MNGWEFMGEHPFLTAFLAVVIGQVVTCPIKMWFRHRNIVAKGWPPPHLDADGDLSDTEED